MEKGISNLKSTRFLIAFIVVLAAFILIGSMLYQQSLMTERFFTVISDTNFDNATSANLIGFYEKLDKSNQTIFTIILPVISAWVGAVTAFYFSSKSTEKAQDVNEKAQSIISKLVSGKGSDITIKELLSRHPESKEVETVTSQEKAGIVKDKATKYGNVVLKDDKNGIFGVLYLEDLKDYYKAADKDTNLEEFFKKYDIVDKITKTKWSDAITKKIENYAKLSYEDKLSSANEKMQKVKGLERDVLGLVFENDELKAAINYQTLARYV